MHFAMRHMLLIFVAIAVPLGAIGQQYPSKSIRVITPFSTGTAVDAVARVVGKRVSDALGQQVVVDNRVGAGGIIGTVAAAKSPSDGYTLYLGNDSFVIAPNLYKAPSYDPVKDFAPVALVANIPLVLLAHPSFPAKSVKELIALAKARPDQINYGSGGATHRLLMETFQAAAGINLVHVAYKGAGPALNDLLGGQIPLMFAGVSNAVPYVAGGRLRILAVSSARRATALPEVPTLAEAALPGFDYAAWVGYFVPAGTPAEIINRLYTETIRALGQPDVQEIFVRLGFEVTPGTPEELAKLIQSDMVRVKKVIREAGIPVE